LEPIQKGNAPVVPAGKGTRANRRATHFDHFDHRWTPRPLTPSASLACRQHRQQLLEQLIREITAGHNSISKLYAGLLARTLCQADPLLMERFGARVAQLVPSAPSDKSGLG
jgi:hypothetical protein